MLMVFIPGHVLQLVNCGSSQEPGHHITLLGKEAPNFPVVVANNSPNEERQAHPLTYFELDKPRCRSGISIPLWCTFAVVFSNFTLCLFFLVWFFMKEIRKALLFFFLILSCYDTFFLSFSDRRDI